MKASEQALKSMWTVCKSTAKWEPGSGLCKAWSANVQEWGPPIEVSEQNVDLDGRMVRGRTFLKIGMVVWVPESGAEVVGWMALQ